ncbi:MAG: phosphoribosylanthranilate isomerase [Verrucomicrobiota bacterium]|jgi:phosphoribosylanthranilate isomerase
MFDDNEPAAARPRVKICGITNVADAEAAIEFGADALGFNFFRGSKRYLPPDAAMGWMAKLPAEVAKVAVVVDAEWEDAVSLAALPFVTALQLHGRETPDFCRKLAEEGIRFAKALPVATPDSLRDLPRFFTRTLVLDTAGADEFGGSGRTFPWEIAREFVEANPELRVILAGGLTPENVAAGIAAVRPFGVDVTSGVELSAGRKDRGLLRAFISAARG